MGYMLSKERRFQKAEQKVLKEEEGQSQQGMGWRWLEMLAWGGGDQGERCAVASCSGGPGGAGMDSFTEHAFPEAWVKREFRRGEMMGCSYDLSASAGPDRWLVDGACRLGHLREFDKELYTQV